LDIAIIGLVVIDGWNANVIPVRDDRMVATTTMFLNMIEFGGMMNDDE